MAYLDLDGAARVITVRYLWAAGRPAPLAAARARARALMPADARPVAAYAPDVRRAAGVERYASAALARRVPGDARLFARRHPGAISVVYHLVGVRVAAVEVMSGAVDRP
ncbi:MAG TPA: hypothetical protein VFW96_02530 [Thermomicrobiales bacterium]|nr:hypothetical protein [Thermomicrobiales bacterium]